MSTATQSSSSRATGNFQMDAPPPYKEPQTLATSAKKAQAKFFVNTFYPVDTKRVSELKKMLDKGTPPRDADRQLKRSVDAVYDRFSRGVESSSSVAYTNGKISDLVAQYPNSFGPAARDYTMRRSHEIDEGLKRRDNA
ncbi:hypothetical protein [Paraburkholderia humisilvae]|nr:hypothetical protein [Paraburkholderia humisilvae]